MSLDISSAISHLYVYWLEDSLPIEKSETRFHTPLSDIKKAYNSISISQLLPINFSLFRIDLVTSLSYVTVANF